MLPNYHQQKRFGPIWMWFGSFLLLLFLIYPYLKTEITTNLLNEEIVKISEVCQEVSEGRSKLKYIKVVDFQNYRGQASVMCVYDDSRMNREIFITKKKDWELMFSENINKEQNVYWPVYL